MLQIYAFMEIANLGFKVVKIIDKMYVKIC